MFLITDITPRKDGTVTATTKSGATYKFRAGKDGILRCEVKAKEDIECLLDTGNFHPGTAPAVEKVTPVSLTMPKTSAKAAQPKDEA